MMDTEYTEPNYTFEVTTMIIDKTSNLELYKSLIPHLDVILNFARTAAEKPVGTYPYPGGRIMIQEGETRALEGAEFESHKNFLDLQWILEGKEMMEYANIHDLTETVPYNAEKDIQFWQGKGSLMEVPAGTFYLVYPEDGHKPCLSYGEKEYLSENGCQDPCMSFFKKMEIALKKILRYSMINIMLTLHF